MCRAGLLRGPGDGHGDSGAVAPPAAARAGCRRGDARHAGHGRGLGACHRSPFIDDATIVPSNPSSAPDGP